ncbi:MAG: hypothetical protein JXR76_15330 [Deltaproteobacteria bacterium]|nr:hypothetical protein [Deltaproteobacteria bacterium]
MKKFKEPIVFFVRHMVEQTLEDIRENRISRFEAALRLLLTSLIANAGSLSEGTIELNTAILTTFFEYLGGDESTGSIVLTPNLIASKFLINGWDQDLFICDNSSVLFLEQFISEAMTNELPVSCDPEMKEARDGAF